MNKTIASFRMACRALIAAFICVQPVQAVEYVVSGNVAARTPGNVSPGLLLLGGGHNPEALRWFLDKAGHGHIVVLEVSGGTGISGGMSGGIGGAVSVETFVFDGRGGDGGKKLLKALKRADGIVIAGGDEARHLRALKLAPIAQALDAHVAAGKPLAGTGAGLAALGGYSRDSRDGDRVGNAIALADPLGDGGAIENGFLRLKPLTGMVLESHFAERERLGRLLAFVAKAEVLANGRTILGLGVDEAAALTIDADGNARLYATHQAATATLVHGGFGQAQRAGEPLRIESLEVLGIGPDSLLRLPEGSVEQPAFQRRYAVRDGVLTALSAPVLVIHGGAGVAPADITEDEEQAARVALEKALRAGHAALVAGSPALDAVTAAITVLEDDPMFNSARGAVFTHDGRNELDASIMDGTRPAAGAVAGVRRVKNPILLAREVMEHSPHVMMIGDGAEAFAQTRDIELVDPSYFHTARRWRQLQKALEAEARQSESTSAVPGSKYFGTVGAVALDNNGHLAAGTSTGGMTNKRYGRVGDAPIIGAGTWADTRCAVSGTGWGEFYIRAAAAHDICARMKYAGQSLREAAETVIVKEIPGAGGNGGAIALGADGSIAMPFNTPGMYRGWVGPDGIPHVAIWPASASH